MHFSPVKTLSGKVSCGGCDASFFFLFETSHPSIKPNPLKAFETPRRWGIVFVFFQNKTSCRLPPTLSRLCARTSACVTRLACCYFKLSTASFRLADSGVTAEFSTHTRTHTHTPQSYTFLPCLWPWLAAFLTINSAYDVDF